MKMRQPYHLSWQLLTVAIIIAFIAFVEYWPHLSDDALMGSGSSVVDFVSVHYIWRTTSPTRPKVTRKSNTSCQTK